MFTPKGKAFILFLAFCLFLSWYTQAKLAYFICALACAILLISFILFKLIISAVECLRQAPTSAYEGDIVYVSIALRNRGYLDEEFLNFSDLFTPQVSNPEKYTFIGEFPKGQEVEFSYKGECSKRGAYSLGPCVLSGHDFFGFFKKERKLYPPSKLIVLSRGFKIGSFPLGIRSSNPRYGRMVVRRAGEYEEFYGVREYSKEDGLRKIHWPTSAKQNKLMVRHFEQSSSYMGSIFLDLNKSNNIGEGRHTTLEYAIKITASLGEHLINTGGNIQVLAYNDTPLISSFGQTKEHYMMILEAISVLESNSQVSLSESLGALQPFVPPSSSLIIFVMDNDIDTQNSLRLLAVKKDLFIIEIIMVSSSFKRLIPSGGIRRLSYEPPNILKYYVGYKDPLGDIFMQSGVTLGTH